MRAQFMPAPARIERIVRQTYDTVTFTLTHEDAYRREFYKFQPGQFNMISMLGIGEAPISISSWHGKGQTFDHTIRAVGAVTNAMMNLREGDRIWIRGPYGRGWPITELAGKNVLLVAGGIGLAPLRPIIEEMIIRPQAYGKLEILYGARTPEDLLFTDEYDEWKSLPNIDFHLTVDRPGIGYTGRTGPVTVLFDEMRLSPQNTVVVTCGPEIMMKFVVKGLVAKGWSPGQIFVSLERRMECGFGKCGHCQCGPLYVCKDGPVFNYTEIRNLPEEIF